MYFKKCSKNKRFDLLHKLLEGEIDIVTAKKLVDQIVVKKGFSTDLEKIEKLFDISLLNLIDEGEKELLRKLFFMLKI